MSIDSYSDPFGTNAALAQQPFYQTGNVFSPPALDPSAGSPGMTPMQRQMMARALMQMQQHQTSAQTPQLNLGDVQGNLPGGGVSSQYGVV